MKYCSHSRSKWGPIVAAIFILEASYNERKTYQKLISHSFNWFLYNNSRTGTEVITKREIICIPTTN